jgi:hypothetical protein
MTLKMAVLAPMPSASVRLANKVKPGCFRSIRAPLRRSWPSVFIRSWLNARSIYVVNKTLRRSSILHIGRSR